MDLWQWYVEADVPTLFLSGAGLGAGLAAAVELPFAAVRFFRRSTDPGTDVSESSD